MLWHAHLSSSCLLQRGICISSTGHLYCHILGWVSTHSSWEVSQEDVCIIYWRTYALRPLQVLTQLSKITQIKRWLYQRNASTDNRRHYLAPNTHLSSFLSNLWILYLVRNLVRASRVLHSLWPVQNLKEGNDYLWGTCSVLPSTKCANALTHLIFHQ